jgi:hypothetical protein
MEKLTVKCTGAEVLKRRALFQRFIVEAHHSLGELASELKAWEAPSSDDVYVMDYLLRQALGKTSKLYGQWRKYMAKEARELAEAKVAAEKAAS